MPERGLISFAAVRGHERVRDRLRAASTQNRLAHALVFAGPDGIGKRAMALGLAAFLECGQRGDDACGACASCAQVAAGSHPDVQIVGVPAGKKEIGVERIRELKRFTQLQPVCALVKVVIIDDAHALTVAAQNALLKTLEEPPERSFLILVAHNSDALLPTVRSRCQLIRFAPLPTNVVEDILTTAHGIEASVATQVAPLAEGSPGRALLLSRYLAPEALASLDRELAGLRTARYVALMRLVHELTHPDAATAVKLEMTLSHFRDEAVQRLGAVTPTVNAPGLPPSDDRLRSALRRADTVHEASVLLRRGNPNRQLLLEALLLRLARV